MDKQAKLKTMWNELPTMEKETMMQELRQLGCTLSYEEIVTSLNDTYDDLKVADQIFAMGTIDDSKSRFPKEFIDEAVTQIARIETFGFTHYGVIVQDLERLAEPLLSQSVRLQQRKQCFDQFLSLCKRFKLDHFDALVYTINDQFDMGKAILAYLDALQKTNDMEQHREVTRFVDRFFQLFAQVNPWLDEQLQFAQATSFIQMKSAKGEKLFQQMMKTFPDVTEVIYRYGFAQNDAKKMRSIYERYQKQLQKDSEYYPKIQAFLHHK